MRNESDDLFRSPQEIHQGMGCCLSTMTSPTHPKDKEISVMNDVNQTETSSANPLSTPTLVHTQPTYVT